MQYVMLYLLQKAIHILTDYSKPVIRLTPKHPSGWQLANFIRKCP